MRKEQQFFSKLIDFNENMNRFLTGLIFFIIISLFSCAVNNPAKNNSDRIVSGMKEIQKGTGWYQKGCYKRSLRHFLKAHKIFTVHDQQDGVAMSMNNIGNVYRITGDMESAVCFFEESFKIYTYIEDKKGMVQALSNKAAAFIDAGKLEDADKTLKTAENIMQKSKICFVPLITNRGIFFTKKKKYIEAEKVLKSALENADHKNLSEFATANFALGNLMLQTKRSEKAVDFFKRALESDHGSGYRRGIADDLASIGSVYLSKGKNKEAVKYFERSVKIYSLTGNSKKVEKLMAQLEKASERAGIDISVTKQFVKNWIKENSVDCFYK